MFIFLKVAKKKITSILVPAFLAVFLFTSPVYAKQGCCSWHGGIAYCDHLVGSYVCNDGTYSPTCTCYIISTPTKTPYPTSKPWPTWTPYPTSTPRPTSTPEPISTITLTPLPSSTITPFLPTLTTTPRISPTPTKPVSIISLIKEKGEVAGTEFKQEGFFSRLFDFVFNLFTFNIFSDEKDYVLPVAEEATPSPSSVPNNTFSTSTSNIAGMQRQSVKVTRVIDGDTIEIEGGQKIRYIGIDTPETIHPNKPVECYGKEASNKNKELVEGKTVDLERDVSEIDKYGRLLRYVWLGDLMVNEYLVREGYAQSSTYPPDVKYQDRFLEDQRKAKEEEKGLWNSYCDNWGQSTQPTSSQVQSTQSSNNKGYTCNCSKTCSQMSSCHEAYFQLNQCGCLRRDGDKDGVPCENICLGG